MDGILPLFFMCLLGGICAMIAHSKGRNAVGWFFCGLVFHFIALIIIIALSDPKAERAVLNAQLELNRRLRNQGQRTRRKVDQLATHTLSRLDQHDRALGMDSRSLAPPLDAKSARVMPPALPLARSGARPAPILPNRPRIEEAPAIWFWNDGSEARLGPVTIHDLRLAVMRHRLLPQSLVWTDGMETWQEAGKVEGLDRIWDAQMG